MKYCKYIWISIFSWIGNISYADCVFTVVNDSPVQISVEAGYYNNKTKVGFIIQPSQSVDGLVKSDFKCNEINQAGMGLTYVNLVNGKSLGGWVFDPNLAQIRAVGVSGTQSGAIGHSANGTAVYLANTKNPAADRFIVTVKSVQSTARQGASMY